MKFVQVELMPFAVTFALCSAGEAGFNYNFFCRGSEMWLVLCWGFVDSFCSALGTVSCVGGNWPS